MAGLTAYEIMPSGRVPSRGSVTLADADPRSAPNIDPRFLSAGDDLVWNLGLGCDGVIHLLLQRLERNAGLAVLEQIDRAHRERKAVLLAGFGHDNLRLLPSDPATRALPAGTLAQAMADDVAAGRQPAAVIASLGTTGVTAFDPVGEMVAAAAPHGAWVGAAAVTSAPIRSASQRCCRA